MVTEMNFLCDIGPGYCIQHDFCVGNQFSEQARMLQIESKRSQKESVI